MNSPAPSVNCNSYLIHHRHAAGGIDQRLPVANANGLKMELSTRSISASLTRSEQGAASMRREEPGEHILVHVAPISGWEG